MGISVSKLTDRQLYRYIGSLQGVGRHEMDDRFFAWLRRDGRKTKRFCRGIVECDVTESWMGDGQRGGTWDGESKAQTDEFIEA